MQLSNRLIRSATASMNRSDIGSINPKIRKLYTELAKGGIGLIIINFSYATALDVDMPAQFDLH